MANNPNAVEVRVNMYTLMSVVLHSADLATVALSLNARVRQAPNFFSNTPVIVDFSKLSIAEGYNYNALFKVIRQQKLLPVAVRGLPEKLCERMQEIGVPVVEINSPQASVEPKLAEPSGALNELRGTPGQTMVIESPLLAGQKCYAPEADLIVLGDCQPDNELIADGNIHVYGVLRGRAICGLNGDRRARIFCDSLQAESVAVADQSLALAKPAEPAGKLQILLVNNKLAIRSVILNHS